MDCDGGKALDGLGPFTGYQTQPNSECRHKMYGSQTAGEKVRSQKGNSPDRQLRSRNYAQWKKKCDYEDSQEVGLEAAIPSKSA
jgi:hypothetical protein